MLIDLCQCYRLFCLRSGINLSRRSMISGFDRVVVSGYLAYGLIVT